MQSQLKRNKQYFFSREQTCKLTHSKKVKKAANVNKDD